MQAVVIDGQDRIRFLPMGLFLGTSGWAYPEWQPGFYPEGLARARFLGHYSSQMGACEVNATFYRLQSESTFERWASDVGDDFRFVIKAHRRITHGAGLMAGDGDGEFVARFCESLRPLGTKLGAVLLQFPPTRRRDDEALGRLLDALPTGLRVACEFRHTSWDDESVNGLLMAAGTGRCLADTEGVVPASLPPGPIGYVRLRSNHYSSDARLAWSGLLASEGRERDVYAFAKHEGVPAGDPHAGIGLAQWLRANAAPR